jgi:hypothetical protein
LCGGGGTGVQNLWPLGGGVGSNVEPR